MFIVVTITGGFCDGQGEASPVELIHLIIVT